MLKIINCKLRIFVLVYLLQNFNKYANELRAYLIHPYSYLVLCDQRDVQSCTQFQLNSLLHEVLNLAFWTRRIEAKLHAHVSEILEKKSQRQINVNNNIR